MKRLYTGTEFFNLEPVVFKQGNRWIIACKNEERKELVFVCDAPSEEDCAARVELLKESLLKLCVFIDSAEEMTDTAGWRSFLTCSAILHVLTNLMFRRSIHEDDQEKMLDDFKEAAMRRLSLLRERLPEKTQ
jgi:hypothetical protein